MTMSLMVSAGLAPLMGAIVDRGHGRSLVVGGALLGAGAMLGLAAITSLTGFYVVWFLLGIAMAACLYEPCFAILTRQLGGDAKKAIIVVTLFGGFASTLSFPFAHIVVTMSDWRWACIGFAIIAGAAAVMLAWSIGPDREAPSETGSPQDDGSGLKRALVSPVFWLLFVAFAMVSLNHGGIITHIMPLLEDRNLHQEGAVIAASMIGPMQVMGRLAMMAAGDRTSAATVSATAFICMTLAAFALMAAPWAPAMVVAFVVLQGAAYGTSSIVRPAITAEWLGRRSFGAIAGILAIPLTAGYAISPTIMAGLEAIGGYDLALLFAAGCTALGLIAILMAGTFHRRRQLADDAG